MFHGFRSVKEKDQYVPKAKSAKIRKHKPVGITGTGSDSLRWKSLDVTGDHGKLTHFFYRKNSTILFLAVSIMTLGSPEKSRGSPHPKLLGWAGTYFASDSAGETVAGQSGFFVILAKVVELFEPLGGLGRWALAKTSRKRVTVQFFYL